MLKVGLVGVGGISGAHISAWETLECAELVALCDIRSANMEKYSNKSKYQDFDEMLDKEELDIIDICLPTHLHTHYAIKAMERGLHVICEKPISLKEEDIKRIYDTANRMKVNFMVAQVLRFWPEYVMLKEIYETKQYGELLSGFMRRLSGKPKWSWDNWMNDESRSGLVPFDLHIHDLDFMVYTFGEPQEINVDRVSTSEHDFVNVVYNYPNFFIESEASWYGCSFPFTAGFRFVFEKAIISYDAGECVIYENDGNVINMSITEQYGSIKLSKSNAYVEELLYFVECIQKGEFAERVKAQELETVIRLLKTL